MPAPLSLVLLGANGFVGRHFTAAAQAHEWNLQGLTRAEADLIQPASAGALAAALAHADVLVFTSAITPDRRRDNSALQDNIAMAATVVRALHAGLRQVVYLSSDAVFAPDRPPIKEETPPCPDTLYGTMHLAREQMLGEVCAALAIPLAIIRPCALYGKDDTHNAYGPNRFLRTAENTGRITLFGAGEDVRPHLFIDDLIAVMIAVITNRIGGIIHAIPEESHSFAAVAACVQAQLGGNIVIDYAPRAAPATHKHFSPRPADQLFPALTFTPLHEGIAQLTAASATMAPTKISARIALEPACSV